MVSEKDCPLAVRGYLRKVCDDLFNGCAILLTNGHKHSGHNGEVEAHVKFVAFAVVFNHVRRPLVGAYATRSAPWWC